MTEYTPRIIYARAEQVTYIRFGCGILRCTMLSNDKMVNTDKKPHKFSKIKYPDAALNRLTKITGHDYLCDGNVIFLEIYKYGVSAMIHCFKKYGSTFKEITSTREQITPEDLEPMDPRLTIEYLAGIGVEYTNGFTDIVVSTNDQN